MRDRGCLRQPQSCPPPLDPPPKIIHKGVANVNRRDMCYNSNEILHRGYVWL